MKPSHLILIADDDERFVTALSYRLEKLGFKTITAKDGYNALARTVESKPDLMLLDIGMPAGDGFTVKERVQKHEELAHIPCIYLTGDGSLDALQAAETIGAYALFHKPIRFSELQRTIEMALKPRAA